MSALLALYRAEPARCNAAITGVIVWVLVQFTINVDHATVYALVAAAIPAVEAEFTRAKVTPVKRDKAKSSAE